MPTVKEIVCALESLYRDELRPFGRIVRKRLTERAYGHGQQVDADLARLRVACEACDAINVVAEAGGEWSALLAGREDTFVDVYDVSDPYSEAMWSGLKTYCEAQTGKEAVLPGGRYACAQALAERLPELGAYSLGQVCHIVQLALTQRKILGYVDGGVTAYATSNSMIKDSAAAQQTPCCGSDGERPRATWPRLRHQLKEILADALRQGSGQIALSNIKHVFRTWFCMELSETALGHSKLSELLQDERLCDICKVQLFEQGYFVIAKQLALQSDDSEELSNPDDESAAGSTRTPSMSSLDMNSHDSDRDSFGLWLESQQLVTYVRNTFIHVGPVVTSSRSSRPQSVPVEARLSQDE